MREGQCGAPGEVALGIAGAEPLARVPCYRRRLIDMLKLSGCSRLTWGRDQGF